MSKKSTLLVAGIAAALAACGGDIDSYCDELTECEGGNDKDREVCEQEVETAQEVAEIYDCKDDWDAWFQCEIKQASCQPDNQGNNEYTSELPDGTRPCNEHRDAYTACRDRESAIR